MATCVVSGTITDASSTAIQNVAIKSRLLQPVASNLVLSVPKELSTTTDSNGEFSLTLEQETSYIIEIDYPPNSTDSARMVHYTITVPAESTADFTDIAIYAE